MISRLGVVLITTAMLAGLTIDSDAAVRKERGGADNPQSRRRTPSRTVFGFAMGLFGSGNVTVKPSSRYGDYEYPLKSGYSLSAFVDFPSRSLTTIGLSLETHRIAPDSMTPTVAENMIDLSLNLKINLSSRQNHTVVKPCLALGYGHLPEVTYGGYEISPSTFLVFKAFFEITHRVTSDRPLGFLLQAGVMSSPYGRGRFDNNMTIDVTSGPRLMVRLGMSFQ